MEIIDSASASLAEKDIEITRVVAKQVESEPSGAIMQVSISINPSDDNHRQHLKLKYSLYSVDPGDCQRPILDPIVIAPSPPEHGNISTWNSKDKVYSATFDITDGGKYLCLFLEPRKQRSPRRYGSATYKALLPRLLGFQRVYQENDRIFAELIDGMEVYREHFKVQYYTYMKSSPTETCHASDFPSSATLQDMELTDQATNLYSAKLTPQDFQEKHICLVFVSTSKYPITPEKATLDLKKQKISIKAIDQQIIERASGKAIIAYVYVEVADTAFIPNKHTKDITLKYYLYEDEPALCAPNTVSRSHLAEGQIRLFWDSQEKRIIHQRVFALENANKWLCVYAFGSDAFKRNIYTSTGVKAQIISAPAQVTESSRATDAVNASPSSQPADKTISVSVKRQSENLSKSVRLELKVSPSASSDRKNIVIQYSLHSQKPTCKQAPKDKKNLFVWSKAFKSYIETFSSSNRAKWVCIYASLKNSSGKTSTATTKAQILAQATTDDATTSVKQDSRVAFEASTSAKDDLQSQQTNKASSQETIQQTTDNATLQPTEQPVVATDLPSESDDNQQTPSQDQRQDVAPEEDTSSNLILVVAVVVLAGVNGYRGGCLCC